MADDDRNRIHDAFTAKCAIWKRRSIHRNCRSFVIQGLSGGHPWWTWWKPGFAKTWCEWLVGWLNYDDRDQASGENNLSTKESKWLFLWCRLWRCKGQQETPPKDPLDVGETRGRGCIRSRYLQPLNPLCRKTRLQITWCHQLLLCLSERFLADAIQYRWRSRNVGSTFHSLSKRYPFTRKETA